MTYKRVVFKTFLISMLLTCLATMALSSNAFYRRESASGCQIETGMNLYLGTITVNSPSGRAFTQAVECAYTDDSTLPHHKVMRLSVNGNGAAQVVACTKHWADTGYDCTSPKSSSGGIYEVDFNNYELESSWRLGGGSDFDFAFIRVMMREGTGSQLYGWFAEG